MLQESSRDLDDEFDLLFDHGVIVLHIVVLLFAVVVHELDEHV
jgi:hypothetical protein